MKFDPKRIVVILTGYDKMIHYRLNLDLLRNMSFGKDLWISVIHNGDENEIISGLGENNFLKIENSGYSSGAADLFDVAMEHASHHYRDIAMIFNFDVLWYTEQGFINAIEDFDDSKLISAAEDCNGLLAPDCLIMKKSLCDISLESRGHFAYRENLEIAQRYKETETGFENIEEYLFTALVNYVGIRDSDYEESKRTAEEIDKDFKQRLESIWHKMDRTDLPRLRFSERLTMSHEHDINEVRRLLTKYNCEGYFIKQLLES